MSKPARRIWLYTPWGKDEPPVDFWRCRWPEPQLRRGKAGVYGVCFLQCGRNPEETMDGVKLCKRHALSYSVRRITDPRGYA